MGGHVIFSHWDYFDELLDTALGKDAWNTLERVSYVWMKNRWIAYPFQNNISALPKEDQIKCLTGLVEAKVQNAVVQGKPKNFDEWILRVMGSGIADLFMRPYNFKVWAIPTTLMQCNWLGERVATVDVNRAITNVIHGKEDAGWGPNAVFRFPKNGGTGSIWKGVAKMLPQEKQQYKKTVVNMEVDKKTLVMEDGSKIEYKALLSTMPLDTVLRWLGKTEWADGLQHSSSHIVGVGIRGHCPHGTKCWLYYPEDDCPFYRCTVFSNYAKGNCPEDGAPLPTLCQGDGSHAEDPSPKGGPYWSLMFEISESNYKAVGQENVAIGTSGNWQKVVLETLIGAINTQLLQHGDEVVSLYHRRIEHGYPTPSLGRDEVLAKALPWLQEQGIWSRGRFGSYKYEVANQDHSLMLGVEAADNILFAGKELTLNFPDIVNAKKNTELKFLKRGSVL